MDSFIELLLGPHPAHLRCARSVCRFFMLLLGVSQEVAKKSDFGKPKSLVCLFAVANIARGAGANIARPDVPPWIPLFVPRYKAYQEINIFLGCAVLQGGHHARLAKFFLTFTKNVV